jgi:hypothetical protein
VAIKLLLHKSVYDQISYASLLKDAVHFAVDQFDLADASWRVEIYMQDVLLNDCNKPIWGECVSNHTRRTSKVYVAYNARSVYSVLGTLFHELAHVKQAINEETVFLNNSQWMWKETGKILYSDGYWNSPNEIDARHYQRVLLWKFSIQRIKQMLAQWFRRKPLTEEQLDWNYNDRKSSCAEMQSRRNNMSNPGEKDYEI